MSDVSTDSVLFCATMVYSVLFDYGVLNCDEIEAVLKAATKRLERKREEEAKQSTSAEQD